MDRQDRQTDGDRESLVLVHWLDRQLVSFPGRFIKDGTTKSSEGGRGREGEEPNIGYKHRDLASLRFFGEGNGRGSQNASEGVREPTVEFQLSDTARWQERERERERETGEAIERYTGLRT